MRKFYRRCVLDIHLLNEQRNQKLTSTFQNLRDLFSLFTFRERVQFFCLIPVLLVGSALEVIGIGLVPVFLAAAISPDSFEKIPVVGKPLADLGRNDSIALLWIGSIAVVLAIVLKNGYQVFRTYAVARYCKGRQVSLGMRLFKAYQSAPMETLFQRNTAEIVRNMNSDVTMVANRVLLSLAEIQTQVLTCIGIVAILFLANWKVALFLLILGSSVGAIYHFLLNPRSVKIGAEAMDARFSLVQYLNESLNSIRETRVMSLEKIQQGKIKKATKIAARSQLQQMVMAALAGPMLESIAVIGLFTAILVLVRQPEELVGMVPFLTLLAFSLVRLRSYITIIFSRWNQLSFRLPSVRTIVDDTLQMEALANERRPTKTVPFRFKSTIEAKEIVYAYPGSNEPVISGVSFVIQKGDTVAITGKTGSGKTTLVDLLLGILRPNSGSITIDGIRVEQFESLRHHVGYVPQFIQLFDDTLRNNIALGVKGSKVDDSRVWSALEQAQIADFVRRHPDQLEMQVGENGVRLSGGQRQRLGIARSLYHNPEILVFDEGTSALDSETEQDLIEAIGNLGNEITKILIAHRTQTLTNANRLIDMNQRTNHVSSEIESHCETN